jgi:uncharacterized protein
MLLTAIEFIYTNTSYMSDTQAFIDSIAAGYTFNGDTITLGGGMLGADVVPGSVVHLPLSTMNRHGLIAGATGTGKTKTLQKIAEALSYKGVPVLVMDIKGDLSGISQPGTSNDKITGRHSKLGIEWAPKNLPTEFLTISAEKGTHLRATISEFGPVLFSKILELNDTQSGVVSLAFKYCDDNKIPLLDLKDFKKIVQFLSNEGKEEIEKEYGQISPSSVGTIMRKVIELEEQGAEIIFGEKSFEISDLVRLDSNGHGMINVLRLMDMQTKPKLFSTFMLCLLAEMYQTLPEEGDIERPKFCLFIDEAHLIFNNASQALLDQIEQIIKLIRSKGVGIYFITQNPADIPASVLGQLGLKIQHALRAFTANDRKAIKQASENYPVTDFYKIDEVITELGMGEAFVTALNEKGNPTPLVRVMLCAPETRMDTITDQELDTAVAKSSIAAKYNEVIDRESAYEMLNKKIADQAQAAVAEAQTQESTSEAAPQRQAKAEPSMIESITKNTMVKQVASTAAREITRGIFSMFFGKKR